MCKLKFAMHFFDWRNVILNQIYPDLTCNFPESIDDNMQLMDITIKTKPLVDQYYAYLASNDFESIEKLKSEHPELKRCLINAEMIQKLYDMNIAQQRYYMNDVQMYLQNIVKYRGNWDSSAKYAKYDVVNYINKGGVETYMGIEKEIPIGSLPTDTRYFISLTMRGEQGASGIGLSYRGEWSKILNYQADDCVSYGNKLWRALRENNNVVPMAISDDWEMVLDATITETVPIEKGGTGATSAREACENLGAVSKTGDTMTGELKISNTDAIDRSSLILSDSLEFSSVSAIAEGGNAKKLILLGSEIEIGSISGAKIKNLKTPTEEKDAANKKYVDDNAGGKRTCRFVVGTSTAGWTKKDCDYLCDGTDDQVEIQAAINALPSTGGEVVVLDGTYNIASSIAINKHNITITGNGSSTVLKKMWDSGSYVIPVLDAKMSNICIKYLQIDGNRAVYQSGFGIASGGSPSNINNKYITIIGVTIKNFRYGVYTSFSKTDVGVFDSVFQNIEEAVSVGGNSDYGHYNSFCIISNNRFLSCRQGASVSYGDYILISNNIIYNDSRSDFCFYATESKFVNITSNICFGGNIGVIISDSYNNVSGNIINNCNTGLRIQGSNSNITGNTCINNNSGIELYSSNKCNVTGNTCIRGTGLSSDYTSTQYTICLKGTNNNYNLIANNNIMGKNYVIEGGTGNTFVNNKYN